MMIDHHPKATAMSDREIITKEGLLALIEDRKNDLQQNSHELTPPWLMDRSDPEWAHIRQRERQIRRQTTRLNQSTQKFETDFDLSS
ncbi:hypothetical protein [Roseibium algae]